MWLSSATGGAVSGVTPRSNIFSPTTNRMTGTYANSYDAAGNLLTNPSSYALAYNANNQVTSLASGAWTYLYDGVGNRVRKKAGDGSGTLYLYDALGSLAAEYSTTSTAATWSRDYIRWGGGALIATENAGGPCTTCYFGYDHLGSARIVMDQNANVVARHDYLHFGEEIQSGTGGRNTQFGLTTDVTEKFTGQIRDQEAGMDYFNARTFTPPFMRFNSADPGRAGASLIDPQTWNAYAYVRGNPLNSIDPSGATIIPCDSPNLGGPCVIVTSDDDWWWQGNWWVCPDCIFYATNAPPPPPPPRITESKGLTTHSSCQSIAQGLNPFDSLTTGNYFHGVATSAALTGNWVVGTGAESESFGPTSLQSMQMVNSPLIAANVRGFLNSTSPTSGGWQNFNSSEFLATGLNPTGQFVGSYGWNASIQNGVLTMTLTNPTSFDSAFYHIASKLGHGISGKWSRSTFRPMGTINQTYTITMPCEPNG